VREAIIDASLLTATGLKRPASASALEAEVVSLFDQLRNGLLRYVLSLGLSVPDGEEIVPEGFLALFQHLRQGKSRANLQGWIFKVAHNSALKCRLRSRRNSDRFSYLPDLSGVMADPGPNAEETLAATQRQTRLLAVVRALPEQEQCCLSLRAEGLRYREIAEVLGISLGSVAASIEKSLTRLMRSERI